MIRRRLSDRTTGILYVLAFVLGVASILLIITYGLPALTEGPTRVAGNPGSTTISPTPPPTSNATPSAPVVSTQAGVVPVAGSSPVGTQVAQANGTSTCPTTPLKLDPSNRAFFDRVNNKSSYASSASFDFTLAATLVSGSEKASLTITGKGFANGGQKFALQADLDGTAENAGKTTQFKLFLRVVNNIIYFRVESPELKQPPQWIGLDVDAMLKTLPGMLSLPGVDPNNTSSIFNAIDSSRLGDAYKLLSAFDFGKYISTQRQQGSNGAAIFHSKIDLYCFLTSQELLDIFKSMVSVFANQNITELKSAEQLNPSDLKQIIQQLDVSIDHVISPDEWVIAINGTIAAVIQPPSPDPKQQFAPLKINVTLNANFGGYGTSYTIQPPPDAVIATLPAATK